MAIFRPVEKAVLVGLHTRDRTTHDVDASLDELELLVDTAGAESLARVMQRRDTPDASTFVGRGKVTELKGYVRGLDADAVIFDDELTPAQQRNLEEQLEVKVLDRTIVILDIFAQHASSREGKAQVELAQLTYLLPRLRGWGEAMSRMAGGIGARRGPGETKLEVDRQHTPYQHPSQPHREPDYEKQLGYVLFHRVSSPIGGSQPPMTRRLNGAPGVRSNWRTYSSTKCLE